MKIVGVKPLTTWVLALSFAISPYTHAQIQSAPFSEEELQFLSEQTAQIPIPKNEEYEGLSESALAWSEDKAQLAEQLVAAAGRLEAHSMAVVAAHGEEYLNRLIEEGQYGVEDPKTGIHMEYRLIDKVRVPRFLINGKVYIIVDEDQISRESKHLRQYIARTHIQSGQLRPVIGEDGEVEKNIFGSDKKVSGRDLTILFINKDISEVSEMPKPLPTQWSWWQDYFLATYKRPTVKDFTMSIVMGAMMQGLLTLGVTYVKSHFQGAEFSLDPVYWNSGFGALVGTYYSFYKNWAVNFGSENTRILKQQGVSTIHSSGYLVTMGGELSAMTFVSLITEGLLKNKAKIRWNEIPRIQEATRETDGEIFSDSPTLNKYFGWKKSNVINQLFYLIPYTLSLISIAMIDSSMFKIPGTGITVPVIEFAAVPVAMLVARNYSRYEAKKLKSKPFAEIRARELEALADQHDKDFKNLWKFHPSEWPVHAWRVGRGLAIGAGTGGRLAGRKIMEFAKGAADYCVMLLSTEPLKPSKPRQK